MTAESEIRSLLDDLVAATRSKNIDALMRHYASDVLAFDVVDPLTYKGADGLRERAAAWFSSFDGPIHYELRDQALLPPRP
jgi:ketosteroid isomerase-like protein